MSIMKKIALLFLTLPLLWSCDPATQFKTELNVIKTYQTKLDSIESVCQNIEFDSLVYMQTEAVRLEKIVKSNYAPDTLNADVTRMLNRNKGIRKSLGGVKSNEVQYLNEITALKKQWNDLSKDVMEGKYDHEQIETYMNIEKESFETFAIVFDDFNQLQAQQKETFYAVNPFMMEFTDELLNEQQP